MYAYGYPPDYGEQKDAYRLHTELSKGFKGR